MSDLPHDDSPDTALARALHARGLLRDAPTLVGPYRVVRPLASGGMGAVVEAEDAQGRRVAVKTIHRTGPLGALDPLLLARFRREAELLARLDHPHVVRIHAADLDGETPYLAQDLLLGGSLAERLRTGPLPLEAALDLVEKLGQALAHAHRHGVLHRDLKPSNILFDDRGEPRLVDFGISRSLVAGSLGPTNPGEAVGTPSYMAPEQVEGRVPDERTDLWQLGGVLYACLTGQPPFQGQGPLSTMNAVVQAQVVPPRALRPEVPAAVEAVVLRALRKSPELRHASALELVRALKAARTLPPARLPWRAASATLALLLGAGAIALAVRAPHAGPETPRPADVVPTGEAPVGSSEEARGPLPYPVGQRLRLLHSNVTRTRSSDTATIGSFTLTLDARVRELVGDRTRLDVVLTRVVASFELPGTGAPTLEFDSTRPDEAAPLFQPLALFAGAQIDLEVDLRLGQVARLTGMDAACHLVQEEVQRRCDRLKADPESALLLKLVTSLLYNFHDAPMTEALGGFLDVGPVGRRERWSRQRRLRQPYEADPRDWHVEQRRDPVGGTLSWRLVPVAGAPSYEASGTWTLDAAGRVVGATSEERADGQRDGHAEQFACRREAWLTAVADPPR